MENDTNQQILAELRSMRKWNQWGIIVTLLLLVGACIFAYVKAQHRASTDPWAQVRAAINQENLPKALDLAQKKVAQRPNDYYGYWYLGSIYFCMDNVKKAESEYARAYELYPSNDLEIILKTVRKRLKNEAEKNKKPPANAKK
jgi:cytochrome c-type biogenesis protein CcmH/NrfG